MTNVFVISGARAEQATHAGPVTTYGQNDTGAGQLGHPKERTPVHTGLAIVDHHLDLR
ncbi:hypothetical protein ACFWWM_39315 [Streptomyces sp. NPDC058682]|uniref:hypothetical protein n=1 Tax=Streptomyces sp. NPDC058682 TaxID=3346596 RepID=UPI003669AC5B